MEIIIPGFGGCALSWYWIVFEDSVENKEGVVIEDQINASLQAWGFKENWKEYQNSAKENANEHTLTRLFSLGGGGGGDVDDGFDRRNLAEELVLYMRNNNWTFYQCFFTFFFFFFLFSRTLYELRYMLYLEEKREREAKQKVLQGTKEMKEETIGENIYGVLL